MEILFGMIALAGLSALTAYMIHKVHRGEK